MIIQLDSSNQQLIELSEECFSELRTIYYPNKLAKAQKGALNNNWVSFGYFVSDKLVACVDVKLSDKALSLSSLSVNKKYRRQGIARKLVYGVIDKFENVDIASLWCVKQTGNVLLFESLNFNVIQEVRSELFNLTKGGCAIEVQLTLCCNKPFY